MNILNNQPVLSIARKRLRLVNTTSCYLTVMYYIHVIYIHFMHILIYDKVNLTGVCNVQIFNVFRTEKLADSKICCLIQI